MNDKHNEEQDLSFPKRLTYTAIGVVVLSIGIVAFYIWIFWGNPVGGQEQFGQFGDYIGGLLNPILTFFTIFLLVWSIRIQVKELKSTKKELAISATALQKTQTIHDKSHQLQLNQSKRKELQDAFEYLFNQCDALFSRKLEHPVLLGGSKSLYEISDIIFNTKIFGLDSEEKNSSLELVRIISGLVRSEEYNPGPNRSFYIKCRQSVIELCILLEEFHKYIETQVVSESYSRRTFELLAAAWHTSLINEEYDSLKKMIKS